MSLYISLCWLIPWYSSVAEPGQDFLPHLTYTAPPFDGPGGPAGPAGPGAPVVPVAPSSPINVRKILIEVRNSYPVIIDKILL